MVTATLFDHAQERGIEPISDQRFHTLPRVLPGTARCEICDHGIRNLAFADGILAFAERLPQQINFLLSHFRLRQHLAFERLHSRLVKRKASLIERIRFTRGLLSGTRRSGAFRFLFVRGT